MSAPATPVSAQASIRIRRRRYIPSPRAPPIAASSAPPSSDLPLGIRQPAERTRAVSEGPTIRGIRVAFAETPVKLRELEVGWRERRKASLVLSERVQVVTPARPAEANEAAIYMHGKKEREEARQREKRLPLRQAEPKPTLSVPRSRRAMVADEQPAPTREDISSPRMPLPPTKATASGTQPGTQPVPLPQVAPPSPPPTPPPVLSKPRYRDTVLASAQKKVAPLGPHALIPLPITSVPLPPTNRPVPLIARSNDTIHIHPAESLLGITLRLDRTSQSITITQDGRVITFSAKPAQAPARYLRLDSWKEWSEEDKRDWDIVRRLIEGYKRHTPKVRLYLPLGHLTIACSSPPDILLIFDHASMSSPDIQADPPARTKVRVRLSRLTGQLVVDTSFTSGFGEVFRTKRIAKLPPISASPTLAGKSAARLDLESMVERAAGWSEAEREGVDRLRRLRAEWQRYE